MKSKKILSPLLTTILFVLLFASNLIFASNNKNVLILKVKESFVGEFEDGKIPTLLQPYLNPFNPSIKKIFPNHKAICEMEKLRNSKLIDLSLFYYLSLENSTQNSKIINRLLASNYFYYVEEETYPQLLYTPNDPNLIQQYHFSTINAFNAFDLQQGDTNVVIGITDTGTELFHSELQTQIKYNYADPIDGTDNDNDGYIDNYKGWDLGNEDNNPSPDNCQTCNHGIHVSGISSAATNNNNGIAGVGFKCKFLPIKIQNSAGELNKAYEGIVYAADHGCRIINCSWGNTSGGMYGQDIVNYATFNKNSLVVSAAGNNGNLDLFYPASFDNVLSVAATDNLDIKWTQSNYGYKVDVCAPGVNIYSTWAGNSYTASSGTSMAAPLVSACAAIVLSQFPSYSALQIGEQIKNTCDTIENLASNNQYFGMMGRGRVNLFKSITQTNSPGISLTQHVFEDNNDNIFLSNDTISLIGNFINLLASTNNLTITLRSMDTSIQIIDSIFNVGILNTTNSITNPSQSFRFRVMPNTAINKEVLLKLIYSDTNYTGFDYVLITVNVDYINMAINNISTSITSKSLIGYNTNNTSQGLGFRYNNSSSLLFEGGLMIGDRSTRVMDNLRFGFSQFNSDWMSIQNVSKVEPPIVSELDIIGKITDVGAAANPIGLEVLQNSYAWSSPGNEDYVFINYVVKNNSNDVCDSLYVGIFADWDIMNFSMNKTEFDSTQKMAYSFSTENFGLFAGLKLIDSPAPIHSYAIDVVNGGAGGIDLSDGFSEEDKYFTLSNNRNSAGEISSGNDIASVLSTGPFSINPSDSISVTFALLGANNLANLMDASINADIKFNNILTNTNGFSNSKLLVYPNPSNTFIRINNSKIQGIEYVEVYSIDGIQMEKVTITNNSNPVINVENFENGIYIITAQTKSGIITSKFIVNK